MNIEYRPCAPHDLKGRQRLVMSGRKCGAAVSLQVCVAQGCAAIRQFEPSVVLLDWSIDFGVFPESWLSRTKTSQAVAVHVC